MKAGHRLRPCPWCGRKGALHKNHEVGRIEYWVSCKPDASFTSIEEWRDHVKSGVFCNVLPKTGVFQDDPEGAINAWNRRKG